MTHFSHSDVIPSFEDEDEWDEVDQFPYREGVKNLFAAGRGTPRQGPRLTGKQVGWGTWLGTP